MAQWTKNPPKMQEAQKTQVQSLGQEDPWKRAWQPLQYSCLECPMDRGAWTAHTKLQGRKEEGAERKLISGQ